MHSNAMKELIRLSAEVDNEVSKAVQSATESGVVIGSILKTNLEGAGYTVSEKKLRVVTQVEVSIVNEDTKEPGVLMMGTSENAGDALRHAVLGYMKEQQAGQLRS